jgi:hypothetical protein
MIYLRAGHLDDKVVPRYVWETEQNVFIGTCGVTDDFDVWYLQPEPGEEYGSLMARSGTDENYRSAPLFIAQDYSTEIGGIWEWIFKVYTDWRDSEDSLSGNTAEWPKTEPLTRFVVYEQEGPHKCVTDILEIKGRGDVKKDRREFMKIMGQMWDNSRDYSAFNSMSVEFMRK